jgi:hypothetical protein
MAPRRRKERKREYSFRQGRIQKKRKRRYPICQSLCSSVQLLEGNPLFQRMDPNRVIFPPAPTAQAPAKAPPRPVALTKSFSTSNIPLQPAQTPTPTAFRSISIAGAASASVIMSNITPTASVEDIRTILAGIGGGVRELHIISQAHQSDGGLKVKVTFNNPSEGGRQCIERFNGIVADGNLLSKFELMDTGREISVAFESSSQPVNFTNAASQETIPPAPRGPKAMQRGRQRPRVGQNRVAQSSVGNGVTPRLYSDEML